jgi:outer membrane protein TolC
MLNPLIQEAEMSKSCFKPAMLMTLSIYWLVFPAFIFAQTRDKDAPKASGNQASGDGGIFSIYYPKSAPPLVLENSPRIESLVHGSVLELSLSDALALALENNLDVAVQRYIPEYSQTDLIRSKAGQSPRGFTGGTTPGGLTAGALGAGLSGSGAGSGVGSAGGITGGGGAVQVGSSGSFDPVLNVNFSYDRVTSPLNSKVVSGIYNVVGNTTAFTASFAQMFSLGTSYSLTLNGQRQSSTQQNLLYNPAYVTRFALGANQPLLNGFGRLYNERYIIVARNNTKVAEHVFKMQVINTIVAVENAYWDLAALRESVRVAEQSLSVAQQLLADNRIRLEVGTMSPLDVTSAESEVAARTRDLTVATTNVQLQEATLKNMLVRKVGPGFDSVRIVLKDSMPEPKQSDIPDMDKALAGALEVRPELLQATINLQNQDISVRFTGQALKPGLGVFGFYAGAGLQGETATSSSGIADALGQSFTAEYPEYAGGFSMSIPIRNRQAQADNLRSQLETNQLEIGRQRTRNTISVEVRKAIIGLIQGKAQVESAHKAASLAREMWNGEKIKLEAGASTSYQVILRERDYANAQYAEVGAMITYAKAIVEMDRARGATLERRGIDYADALSGKIAKPPISPFSPSGTREAN